MVSRDRRFSTTLADVAERAQVSRATASLVLRDSPLVARATRERALDAVQELGYVYNRRCQSSCQQYEDSGSIDLRH
jgi:LacI family transcriptional regulator